MSEIENTQMDHIQNAAEIMADSIEAGRWVHTFGCGHATLPIEERHSSGKTLFDVADTVVDTCVPGGDASVPLKNHFDKVGQVSTMGFITAVWMTVTTIAEILEERGAKLYIHRIFFSQH